ncbi:carboxylesterase/lipase family protein [Alteraurantiacibacter aquimixticola]|nr:carboxylesterase family protein [Alteraurantiacibacter aquimixticola]
MLAACASPPAMGNPVVQAPVGEVTGRAEGDLSVFKGIPYAEAPVGDMRWKPPEALERLPEGFDAADFGPSCIQRVSENTIYSWDIKEMSEDCLSLNIWAPEDAENAPVFVWIYGGALVSGTSAAPLYDGAELAKRGIVVVSINYRVGILGYLAHPELSAESADGISGNYGLQDQIEALRWVERNIGAFGGDAGNVTIAGESAGALSVMYLLASPEARGLFDKAIAQSAYMISTPELSRAAHGWPAAEDAGTAIGATLGAPSIAEMRVLDAHDITGRAIDAGYGPWGAVDGKFLTAQLVDTFTAGEQAPVPLMAGFNTGEIRSLRYLLPQPAADAEDYETRIRAAYGDLAEEFLRLYPSSDIEESMLATTRDALYGWTSERLARSQSLLGHDAYLYLWDHGYPEADSIGLHAFHAAELPYVFGTMGRAPRLWPKPERSAAEARLTRAVGDYWASFARTGVPVSEDQPDWLPYRRGTAFMVFEDEPRMVARLFPGMFELHEASVCRRKMAGDILWGWNTGLASPVIPPAGRGCQ